MFLIPATFALGLAVVAVGCGSSEEDTESWETTPAVSAAAAPEARADSMKNENRRIKEQTDALAAENRTLTARNAELETKLNEASAAKAPAPAMTSVPMGNVSGAYNAALGEFRRRNFQEAAGQFEAILNSGTDKLVDNCHYWIGESFYGMKRYDEAIKQFETVLGYTGSGKRPYAQLMIGNSYVALGDKAAAKDAYSKLVSTYPSSALVEKAKGKLSRLQ
jgi:TolA-binding protein